MLKPQLMFIPTNRRVEPHHLPAGSEAELTRGQLLWADGLLADKLIR